MGGGAFLVVWFNLNVICTSPGTEINEFIGFDVMGRKSDRLVTESPAVKGRLFTFLANADQLP